jgi:hypothetical protein
VLLLTSTTDVLRVITSAAVAVDVHASWADYAAGTIALGSTNTAISTAATTTVIGSPAASTQRNVKTLFLRNRDASLSVDVTVQVYNGTTAYELIKITLAAGDTLSYSDELGTFFKIPNPISAPAANYTTSDQTIAAATTAYVTGSDIHNSSGRPWRVGTTLQWRVWLSKTAAGVAARTLNVLFGTTGTSSDTSRANVAITPTAAIDAGYYFVMATMRSIGTSGVVSIGIVLVHNGATTGLGTGVAVNSLTNATFDNTSASLIAGISITTGASEVLTITQVNTEVDNI